MIIDFFQCKIPINQIHFDHKKYIFCQTFKIFASPIRTNKDQNFTCKQLSVCPLQKNFLRKKKSLSERVFKPDSCTSGKHVYEEYTPIEPHFYLEKLGFAGVYLFFLFLLQNIDCGYSLEPPRRGGSNAYPQSMF